ncbi:hypothetical protein ACEPPN_007135 [Leptodophora sp. 'Broadleaf-Isolate-01']
MPRFPNHRGEFTEIENQVWADMINSISSLRDDEIKAKALGIVRQLDFASSSAPASNAPALLTSRMAPTIMRVPPIYKHPQALVITSAAVIK